MAQDVYIRAARRTPIGGFAGSLSRLSAAELGGAAIAAVIEDAQVDAAEVDELLMGCVLSAGQGQAPARQAGFAAGLGAGVVATTVNKMCGSGMKALMLGTDQLRAGNGQLVVAGGMESMSGAPYLLPKMRHGARLGHASALDHMFLDGLEDAYDKGRLMGTFAEDCADKYNFSRQAQDAYALVSLQRAQQAEDSGAFAAEKVALEVFERKHRQKIWRDEQPDNARPDKIPHLKPAFRADGSVTAANASSISDGAAALLLSTNSAGALARVVGHASYAQAPGWFTTAPVFAAKALLDKIGWQVEDVDLWEVNEAFAVVAMAFMHELNLVHAKVNVNGGACALGHPIGASGARIIVTLIHALRARGLRRGVAAVCIGGGEATAVAVEL